MTKNNFKALTEAEIRQSFQAIPINAMAKYILPVFIMLDFSGSMSRIRKEALFVLKRLKESFSGKCSCNVFLILSVIHGCKERSENPAIVYSGFMNNFDYDDFEAEAPACSGITPLVNALNQVTKLGDELLDELDKKRRTHSCPVNFFITDYLENAADNNQLLRSVNEIEDRIEAEETLAIEFQLKDDNGGHNGISFGGFQSDYSEKSIDAVLNALVLSSSTITQDGENTPPPFQQANYNNHLKHTLHQKMNEFYGHNVSL